MFIINLFGKQKKTARKKYQAFIEEGIAQQSPWEELQKQVLLRAESFVKKFKAMLSGKEQNKEISRVKARRNDGITAAYLKIWLHA